MARLTEAAQRPDTSVAPSKPRLAYIDNIRTVLIALVVVGHLAITYGGEGDWYYKEQGQVSDIFSILALPFGAILMASLLGLFSLIAGYFTAPAYDRKGAGGFLLDRIKRLAIPLAFYEVIINPVINYVRDVHEGYAGSFLEFVRNFFSPLKSFGDGPVWFLEMLLIFSIVYAAWRLLARAIWPAADRSSQPTARAVTPHLAMASSRFLPSAWACSPGWFASGRRAARSTSRGTRNRATTRSTSPCS